MAEVAAEAVVVRTEAVVEVAAPTLAVAVAATQVPEALIPAAVARTRLPPAPAAILQIQTVADTGGILSTAIAATLKQSPGRTQAQKAPATVPRVSPREIMFGRILPRLTRARRQIITPAQIAAPRPPPSNPFATRSQIIRAQLVSRKGASIITRLFFIPSILLAFLRSDTDLDLDTDSAAIRCGDALRASAMVSASAMDLAMAQDLDTAATLAITAALPIMQARNPTSC